MARKVRIELVLDAKGVVTGVRKLDESFDDLDQGVKKTSGALKGFKAILGAAFLVAAARQVARFAARMFELGSSVEETGSKFNTVFGEMSGSMDEFGESFANMAGLTKREFEDIASVTASILQGLGADLATSAAETQRVLTLAADLASFNNVSIQEAFAAIRSGLVGESEPLKRFGIVLTEAETKLRALNTTGKQSEKQLSNLEKAQARLNIIFANAGVAIGDLDRTQTSAANEARKFNAIVRETEEILAAALLPALNDVRQAFSETAIKNQQAVTESITFFGLFASKTVAFLGGVLGVFSRFFTQVQTRLQTGLIIIESTISGVLKTVANSVQLINTGLESIGITGVAAIDRFAASTRSAAGLLDDVVDERLRRQMEALGITMGEAAGEADTLTEALGGTTTGAAGGDGGGGGGGAKKGLKGIVETLNDEIKKLAFQVRDLAKADADEVKVLLEKVKTLERELFFRRQLIGLIGGPTLEAPEAVPTRGVDIPGSATTKERLNTLEERAIDLLGERLALHAEMVDALAAQEEAETRLHEASISRALAIGAAQADVLQGILFSVRQIIQARLAEAIAGATAGASIFGPIAAAAAGALMAILFNQLMPSGHKGSSGGAGAGAGGARGSSTGVALAGIRVQNRGTTTGAFAAVREQNLGIRIEVVEPDLFRLNTELSNADGIRTQVGSI